uniref:FBD domain-containing protein n=1 Tax=Aegilops tauschii TaxID=37682 RepID=M8BQW9_AEGTA
MESRSGRRPLRSSAQIGGAAPMELSPGRRLRFAQPQLCSPSGDGGEPDLISSLPQELLLLILALMGCAVTAARTSVLSRRGRHLWTHLGRRLPPRSAVSVAPRPRSPSWKSASLTPAGIPGPWAPRPAGCSDALVLVIRTPHRRLRYALPCFRRTKSLMLERLLFYCPDGEFTALRTLSISYGLGGLHSLLPRCPHLRVLSLKFVNDGFGLVQNGLISLHLPSLQELFLETRILHTDAVDIVAPLLQRLTVSVGAYKVVSGISVSAPMLGKVSWEWWYFEAGSIVQFGPWRLGRLWVHTGERQEQLHSLHVHASHSWFISNEDNFAQEVEKHMVVDFSLLELRLLKAGHVFGALLFHLLGITRISRGLQRLKIVLERSLLKGKCPPHCPCEPTNWRSQTISLTALEEVEINGFEGQEHEFDLLELILKSPILQWNAMFMRALGDYVEMSY